MSSIKDPKVTVLMSVYNGEKYLREAIDSILNQTFKDYEFLIIDDDSTDRSADIIQSYEDERIRFTRNEKNLGVAASSNKGLRLALGKYIARMDCDDISLPERLEKQVSFMDSHPEVGVCGTWLKWIRMSEEDQVWTYPTDSTTIMVHFFFYDPVAHPTTIMNKELLFKNNLLYNESFKNGSDHEFFFRCRNFFALANLGEVLFYYRQHKGSITNSLSEEARKPGMDRICAWRLNELGISPNPRDIELYWALAKMRFEIRNEFVEGANKWMLKIKRKNEEKKIYPEPAFSMMLGQKWFDICNASRSLGIWTWKYFCDSPLSEYTSLSLRTKLTFPMKCLFRYEKH